MRRVFPNATMPEIFLIFEQLTFQRYYSFRFMELSEFSENKSCDNIMVPKTFEFLETIRY